MALQIPKLDLADAKTRIFIIFSGIIGFVIVIYSAVHFLSNKASSAGASHVATAPGNLQSVPGGQLTPEYYRALVQANSQAAKQAKISGGSAVPTLLNEPGAQPAFEQPETPNCTVVCPTEENVNVANDINDLVKAGKLSADEGKKLIDLANKNVAVSEYAAHLDELVKEGKLTPEQARKLLDDYKKQHDNALLQESGKTMDALIKAGKISTDAANQLLDLQKRKVSPAEYAAALNEMVREGKISPETAGQLLAQYTQQQAKVAAAEARGQLEEMAATGQIAPDVAKELEDYQDRHVSPKEYEEELQHLVRQGKLTPEQAQRLLAQYRQQIPPDVAAELADYQKRNVPVAEYQAELQRLVAAGKLSPEQAQDLLEQYRLVKSASAPPGVMEGIVQQDEKANEDAVRQLAASGRISPETAQKLLALQQAKVPVEEYRRQLDDLVKAGKISRADADQLLKNYQQLRGGGTQIGGAGAGVAELVATRKIPPDVEEKLVGLQRTNVPVAEYKRQLDELVREGKISPQEAQQLLQDYQKLHAVREEGDRLNALRGNKAPLDDYANELRQAVAAGIVTPDEAARLLSEYQEERTRPVAAAPTVTAPIPNVKGAEAFTQLQKRVQAAAPTAAPPVRAVSSTQFSAAAAKAKAEAERVEQERIQALMGGMSAQAGQLISSWQPPTMSGQVGADAASKAASKTTTITSPGSAGGASGTGTGAASGGAPLIKAGTIIFAVLDTAINSDFPDSPVLATVVSGPTKGAKLLGKIAITKDQDRVALTFKLMDMEDWASGKTINAYAIDPDTARTALASNVNYHYFLRFGGLFASSFLQGYASAISNSGATTSSGIFGTTTTHPTLSPASKIMTGLGQVGQTLGTTVQTYVNTPPTVKIDPGTSLGILFMQDVAA